MKLSKQIIKELEMAATTASLNQSAIWLKALANALELIAFDIRKEVDQHEKEGKP